MFQLIIYFDNPITRWQYSQHPNAPMVESDVMLRKNFRWKAFAEGYARSICKRLKNVKWKVEPA